MRSCVVLATLLMAMPVVGFAQLSPGPLSKAHEHLEGMVRCGNCHAFGMGSPQLKCLSCHIDIKQRLSANRGYHARTVDPRKPESDCARCHAEHAGREFKLIRWPSGISAFDHTQTGYPLEGKHAKLTCGQCHTTRSYLEAKTDCVSCHKDAHRGQLGSECRTCHSTADWKPTTQFDHSKTRFALTGLHARVACNGCHMPAVAGAPARFKDVPFTQCTDCHRDPHNDAFKGGCRQCHDTSGWRVTRATTLASFDHSQTKYPLTGKHSVVSCGNCHKTPNFNAPVRSAKCIDCHSDKHRGQFAMRPTGIECGACHTVNGFKPSTFDLKQHGSTRYPLLGKHASVTCNKCHEPKGAATDYHPRADSCGNCHRDIHAGQFSQKYGDRCEACHQVEAFSPSTFTMVRHRDAGFILTGAHTATACTDCHRKDAASGVHQYRFPQTSCVSCHRDPHGSTAQTQSNCETCHTVQTWTSLVKFDHNSTRFVLTGAHRAVSCTACHKSDDERQGLRRVSFKGTTETCSGCHNDIHAGQFTRRDRAPDCGSCHTTQRWQPSRFDHATARFQLDGAHQKVSCGSCHKGLQRLGSREVLVYNKAPRECAGCH